MPQMMRERMPEVFVITVTSQRPEVLVGVAGMPVNRVVISPAHDVATISKPST